MGLTVEHHRARGVARPVCDLVRRRAGRDPQRHRGIAKVMRR